ncbi:MAG: AI-2E family transporter [Ruminococcaceae bacterium]|nr:AI-2E family transporter [Oscillospiraceae bacterium]
MDNEKISSIQKKTLVRFFAVLAVTVFIVFLFFRFDSVMATLNIILDAAMPFLCGLAFAFVLNVFVNLFEKHIFKYFNKKFEKGKIWNKIKRPICLVLSYLVIALFITLIALFIIPELILSVEGYIETAKTTLPVYFTNIAKWVVNFVNDLNISVDINATLNEWVTGKFDWSGILEEVSKFTSDMITKLVSATVNLASGIFTFVMALIYSVYFLSGKEKLIHSFKKVLYAFIPRKPANKICLFLSVSNYTFSNYIRGQLTECVILGLLCYIGMSIIGFEYALLISTIIALTALIPILGAYIGAGIGSILLLMVNPMDVIWFLIFIICLQQLEGNVIYPRVVGSSMGLPGVWTLTAVMTLGSLLGIPGILLGTPLTAVFYRLIKYKANKRLDSEGIDDKIIDGSEVREEYLTIIEAEITEEGAKETSPITKKFKKLFKSKKNK